MLVNKVNKTLENKISEYLSQNSELQLEQLLSSHLNEPSNQETLTVICDNVVHRIPDDLIIGEKFIMSKGNFDTSSNVSIDKDLGGIAAELIEVLKSNDWKSIRVIFTGHAILGALAKYLSYRICHLETTDIIYFGSSGYKEFKYLLRDNLVSPDF